MIKAALAGLVVLIIGDSHNASKDFLLASLHEDLVADGAAVDSYGACAGRNPMTGWRRPSCPAGAANGTIPPNR